jgi:hypothetical protein
MPTPEIRPLVRSECIDGPRPCPWVSCRHHLALRVTTRGEVRVTFPDAEGEPDLDAMEETCALDVADRGPQDVATIARLVGLDAERVIAVVEKTMRKMAPAVAHLRGSY